MTTSWPKVRDTCNRLGWGFDGWQDGAGKLILSKGSDGLYAADTIVISIPRQVGKTYLIACIIFALCLLEPGVTVIWTAHRKTTASETFAQFDGMAQRPKVAVHVRQVLRGKGDEKILFNNGSRILFGARESGFGRGMTDIDVLVWDEGQILGAGTLEDMGAAQNVAKDPLTFVMGTPPRPKDPSEFFTLMRKEALDGDSEGTLYIEFSADRGGDLMDRAQWRKANPSFPKRTTERAMLRLRKKLKDDDSWRREALGVWDEEGGGALSSARWMAAADPDADRGRQVVFGLDLAGRDVWLAVAWDRGDDSFVMLANDGRPLPAYKAVAECKRLKETWGGPVATSWLGDELERGGVEVVPVSGAEFAVGCGIFADRLDEGRIHHGNQGALNDSVRATRWRNAQMQSGERAFQLKDAPEAGPAAAVARALFGLEKYAAMPQFY